MAPPADKADVIANICDALSAGPGQAAADLLRACYPFAPLKKAPRKYTKLEMMRAFIRDGFIDRYSGAPLVFPGTLRILSQIMPDEFPFHPHGLMTKCHMAFWELLPTIDHITPVSRGGLDEPSNWATTSMLRNAAKSASTLDELGWKLHPSGSFETWDGTLGWCREFVAAHPEHRTPYVRHWLRAAGALSEVAKPPP